MPGVVRVEHAIDVLASDLDVIRARFDVEAPEVVRENAEQGNAVAKAFASQQHTMFTDIDVPYHESFSAERIGVRRWEYGPVASGPPGKHGGTQATGYEFGSDNQPPHFDLARSRDIIGPRFGKAVHRMTGRWFW